MRNLKHFSTAAFALSLCVSATPQAFGQGNQSARALAMASSMVSQPYGLEAVAWNPAGIYAASHPLQFDLFGVGARIRNNSFTIDDYNRYTGATLSDEDKQYILDQVPQDGLRLDAVADAQAMSIRAGAVAVSVTSNAAANLDLSRDALKLLLYGNATFDTVNLSGTGGESSVTAGVGFTMARPVAEFARGRLIAGGTVRYVKGLYVQKVVESYGQITTADYGIEGDAKLVARTANNGSGLAGDVGVLYDYGGGWKFGASVVNLFGAVSWSGHPEEHVFTFAIDTLNVVSADDDSLIVSNDSTYGIDAFSTRLPAVLRFGAGHEGKKVNWAAQWEQGLNTAPGTSTSPRLSAGTEWLFVNFLPLRAGLSVGGEQGLGLNWGGGVRAAFFYLDLGFGFNNGLSFGQAKGFDFALNTGLQF
jgi:hypothetical protein